MRLWIFIVACFCLSACAPRVVPAPSPPVPAGKGPVAARGTAGCRAAPVTPPARLEVGGRVRELITVVPADYNSHRPHALVVAFHGRTNSSVQAREYFGLESAMPGTIFVYPSGLRQNGSYSWSDPGDRPDALRDYIFFDEIVRLMSATYCLEPSRVFVVGHSLGAHFANSLACARAGVVRGVASLGGGISGSSCRGGVAAMILHNPNDHLVPVAQGEAARDTFLAVGGWSGPTTRLGAPLMQAFRCVQYGAGPNPVLWCPHPFDTRYDGSYYPHTWPPLTAAALAFFFDTLP